MHSERIRRQMPAILATMKNNSIYLGIARVYLRNYCLSNDECLFNGQSAAAFDREVEQETFVRTGAHTDLVTDTKSTCSERRTRHSAFPVRINTVRDSSRTRRRGGQTRSADVVTSCFGNACGEVSVQNSLVVNSPRPDVRSFPDAFRKRPERIQTHFLYSTYKK